MKENEDSTYLLSKLSEFKSCSCWASTVSFVCFVGQHVFRQFPTSSTIGSCFLGLCSVRVQVCAQAHTIEKQLASVSVRCAVLQNKGERKRVYFRGLIYREPLQEHRKRGSTQDSRFPQSADQKDTKEKFSDFLLCLSVSRASSPSLWLGICHIIIHVLVLKNLD